MRTPTLAGFLIATYVPRRPGISPATVQQYRYAVGSLDRFAGHAVRLKELTDDLFLGWMSWRLKARAPRTVKRERGDLLTLWRAAGRRKLCPPPQEVEEVHVQIPEDPPIAWTVSEYERLVATARARPGMMRDTGIPRGQWWGSLLLFLWDTGARLSASLAVRSADFSIAERSAILRASSAKTKRGQLVRLSDSTVAAVAAHHDPDRELVWPWPYNHREIFRHLKRLLVCAGLPSDRYRMFHCCRRTMISHCAAVDMELAQRQAGHSSRAQTMAYCDPRILNERSAVDVLPRLKLC